MVARSVHEAEEPAAALNHRYHENGIDPNQRAYSGIAVNKTVVTGTKIFKRAELTPNRVTAGENVEFIITLTIGKGYTSGPSRIIFDFPCTLGQSHPTLMHHEDFGFLEVYVSNPDVTYTRRIWDLELTDFVSKKTRSWRGKAERIFVLDLSGGLKEGDVLKIHWGDNQRGFGPGTNITCVVPVLDYENTIHVRYFDSPEQGLPDMGRSFKGYQRPVPQLEIPLAFKIFPRELHHLRLIRKINKAMLIPHDRFWNVSPIKELSDLVEAADKPVKNESGVFEYANKDIQVTAKKFPLLDSPNMEEVFEGMNIYWGDLHTHSAFSKDCIEREKMQMTPADLMKSARERAGLDFYSVSDHHLPWDIERNKIGKENWDRTIEAVRVHNKPGEFLVFPGFEFRGPRGDTIITFGWLPEYEEIDRPEWQDIQDVWEALKGKDYLTQPHFHNPGKLTMGEWWQNMAHGVEPVIEVFSCHGSYERENVLENARAMIKRFRADRCGAFFLSKGLHYGFVCNSDNHKGHVGLNGLTAVYSKSLDKNSIFEAYRQRHVYGTTNARIRLLFMANGQLMGSVVPNSEEKIFLIDVIGENNLKKIDLFRNGVHHKRFIPAGKTFKSEFRVEDHEPSNWYVRITQIDNQIAFSSPVFFV
ncbi:MAG: hypothetical protein ACE5NG_12915 [bacterium]